jgi:hypothetical protein
MEYAVRKIMEYQKLTNKLNRYWKRLAKESIVIGRDQEIYLPIERQHDNVDASNLFMLAKPTLSSLHRRYEKGMERHIVLTRVLENLLVRI